MFNKFYKNGGKYLILFLIFNIIYFLLIGSISYALPFILSIFITVWLTPISKFLYKKTRIPKSILNIFCILTSILLFIGILFLIALGILNETKLGLSTLPLDSLNTTWIYSQITNGKSILDNISPDIYPSILSQLQNIISNLGSILSVFANYIIKIISTIPSLVIGTIITIMTSYFLMRDYDAIIENIQTIDLGKSDNIIRKIIYKIYFLIINYIQSYGILLTITLFECIAIFSLIKSNYTFTLSIICVLLDILPIVGTAIIFFPMAIYYIITGNYIYATILIVSYILMIIIRNIMEPKLLSKTMEIHPILILFSLYVGLKLGGITEIIYIIFLIAFFQILCECEIIKIRKKEHQPKNKVNK